MRLSSQSSQFVFNLPLSFLQPEIIESYSKILDKNWVQYDNIIDYLNSTIKSVNFPGLSFDGPEQILMRAKNVQDIVSNSELQVIFRSVDSDLNYWLLFDILNKHYLDVVNQYLNPFTITCVDIHRDALYVIKFYEIILKSLSDNNFSYSNQKITSKEFTLTFKFNFYDIEFLLDKSKVLETTNIPNIIQKI